MIYFDTNCYRLTRHTPSDTMLMFMNIYSSFLRSLKKKSTKTQAEIKREVLEKIGREQFQKLADKGLGIQLRVV